MKAPAFGVYIGIDYSGAGLPDSPQKGIRVFQARGSGPAVEVRPQPPPRAWSRNALRAWIDEQLDTGPRCLIGIDHAFGFPLPVLKAHGLSTYRQFLDFAVKRWPTDRKGVAEARIDKPTPPAREGYRLCDRWTASSKSLFLFGVPGSVASSTLGGLPGLQALGRRKDVHLWPFDGWEPADNGRHVVAEVYPSLWRRRFDPGEAGKHWTGDQRDAWTVARWLQRADHRSYLTSYWRPPLSPEESRQARREGWILGEV
ncbi:MAG: hypothetical protein SFU85_01520 [Candidatus Methylacidiphilales bacterium]|nr:hypothetical protein [Candidatus Methylacidiphilales bacterium]